MYTAPGCSLAPTEGTEDQWVSKVMPGHKERDRVRGWLWT